MTCCINNCSIQTSCLSNEEKRTVFKLNLKQKKHHCLLKKKVQEVANNYKILLFRPFAICSVAIALNQHLACKHLFIPLPKSPLK